MRQHRKPPTQPRRPSTFRALQRALVALVAFVTVVTSGAQALHMTLVAHHVCETHGQIEHAHDAAHGVTAHEDGAPSDASRAHVAADEDHEDCDVPAIVAAVAEAPAPIASPVALAAPLLTAEHVSVAFVRPLWHLAPKTSPPV